MWYLVSSSSRLRRNHGLDDVLQNVGAQFVVADGLRVLRGNDDRVDAHRLAVLVVFNRDLGLAVGTQIRAACRSCGLPKAACVSLCASEIGVGISSGFSLQA